MSRTSLGALRLVQLALAGATIGSLGAFAGALHVAVLPHGHGFWAEAWAYRLRFATYICPIALGASLMIWAERRFERGYGNDLWSEAELARVRDLVRHKVWVYFALISFVLWAVLLISQHLMRGAGLAYLLVLPSQVAQRVRALISPRVVQPSPLANWRSFGRLRSEHWGHR